MYIYLVEVWLCVEDESLDGDEDLEEVGARVPLLAPLPTPSAQQRDADLPVLVQVRVQLLHAVRPGRGEIPLPFVALGPR